MKKKRTWIGIIILAIIVFFIFTNFHKIKFAISMLDVYTKNAKKSNLSETEGKSSIDTIVDNPLDSIVNAGEPMDTPDDENDLDIDNKEINNEKTDDKVVSKNNPANKGKKSVVTIASKYNKEFTNIQNSFQGQLQGLARQAYGEYQSEVMSTTKLTNKYMGLGSDLERKCDNLVYSALSNMKKELKSNGHDTSLVEEVKDYYQNFKEVEKDRLFDIAFKKMDK